MTRGETTQYKVHYKGKEDDFVVFVDDVESYKKWKEDSSVALAQVVSAFKIFVTHKHGAQGNLDTASKSTLENEFGAHSDDEVIKMILEKGEMQESQMPDRQGRKNDAQGTLGGH